MVVTTGILIRMDLLMEVVAVTMGILIRTGLLRPIPHMEVVVTRMAIPTIKAMVVEALDLSLEHLDPCLEGHL